MIITSQEPVFGLNYRLGYIGFTWRPGNALNIGIAHFSRFERMNNITPGHCLVVTGEYECTEALASKGVCTSPLQEYFLNPEVLVFFRKPRGWTPELGAAIARTARRQVGHPYDFRLLAAHGAANLWIIRRLMSKARHRDFEAWLLTLSNDLQAYICSELCAFALDEQPALRDLGCLAEPNHFIRPQRLIEDDILFAPWKDSGLDGATVQDPVPQTPRNAEQQVPSLSLCFA